MEALVFTFWQAVKILSLAFLALFAAKAVANLPRGKGNSASSHSTLKPFLYSLILALVVLGTWNAAYDVAAEIYFWESEPPPGPSHAARGYSNALQAVELRPGIERYWRALLNSKMRLAQFQSALQDEPVFRTLNGGNLDEEDAYRFALCNYLLDRNDRTIAITQELIRRNPAYAAPYVVLGLAYTGEKKYSQAEESFLAVLRVFPDNQAAVEGLAHACFLAGDRARALAVLNDTAKFHFPPEARKRFEALKGLYDQ